MPDRHQRFCKMHALSSCGAISSLPRLSVDSHLQDDITPYPFRRVTSLLNCWFIEHSYSLLFPPYAGRRGSGFRLLADYHDACKKRLLVRSVDRIPPCCPNSNWSLVMYLRCSGQMCRIRGFSVYRYLRPRSLVVCIRVLLFLSGITHVAGPRLPHPSGQALMWMISTI